MDEPRPRTPPPEPAREPPAPRSRRLIALWATRVLAAIVGLFVFAFFFATRTDRGAGLLVGWGLARVPLNGRVMVGAVRVDRLLEGVRLYEVAVHGNDGKPVLFADSVYLRYDWRTLIAGEVILDSLEMWQPNLTVTRLPGENEFNVHRLLVSGADTVGASEPPSTELALNGVVLHGGEVRVLYPAESEGVRWATVPVPGGEGLLVRHAFTEISAYLPSVLLRTPDAPGQQVEIGGLTMVAAVLENPLRVRDLQGLLRHDDGRFELDAARLALDGSVLVGKAFVERAAEDLPLRLGFDLDAESLDLADFQWADPRVPAGSASGGLAMEMEGDGSRFRFGSLEVASEGSRLTLDGVIALAGERIAFEGFSASAAPLTLDWITPWLERPLPLGGTVEGSTVLDGTPDALTARGRLTFSQPGPGRATTTADFSGELHLAGDLTRGFGFSDLNVTLDPFDFGLIGEMAEGVVLAGPGRMTVRANGHTSDAVRFLTDIHHRPPGLPASDLIAQGSVTRRDGAWLLDVQADVAPLSLTTLKAYDPDLPLTGEVTGAVRARGPLRDLTLTTDLATDAGRLAVTARFDATQPGAYYAVEGEVEGFVLSEVVPDMADPTVITGFLEVEGRGTDPGIMTLDVQASLRPSRVGGLFVDTATLALRAREGVLHIDTLDAVAGGIATQGRGTLALAESGPAGTVELAFRSDSLGRLRPLALGDLVIARDTLTALDRELLLAEGIDPDTLPTRAEVAVAGSVRGELTLSGSVQDFSARGRATFGSLRFGSNVVRGAAVTIDAAGLPSLAGRIVARIEADSFVVSGREFAGAELDVEYAQPRGRVEFAVRRGDAEDYSGRAIFEATRTEGTVEVEALALRFEGRTWSLQSPAVVGWNDAGVQVGSVAIASPGDSVRIEVDGSIPRQGSADLRVDVVGLPLVRLASLAQREDLGIDGRVALNARVTGTRAAPLISGTVDINDLSFTTLRLSRLAGEIDYTNRTLHLVVAAWQDSFRVLTASGQVPVDLAFQGVARRVPSDRQMNLAVVADSLPAALPLAYLSALEDVVGSLSGVFRITGTVDDPSPSGTLTLKDAGWTLAAIGVRHTDISGTLSLRENGTVEVNADGRAEGTIATTGRVMLQPLTDPTFDLVVTTSNFKAVQRPDVEGSVSGAVTLTGTYSRPVVRSRDGMPLRIEEGILYVEEFQRTAGVVDLADPAFFAVVDTSLVNPRPLLGATANPFLRNLRVAVDLVAERNTWLRSQEMNVEMGGELQVVYDRQSRDLVMLGSLQAIRGTYTILGRSFQTVSGSVEFVGTPGINPILNIVAATRVRPAGASAGDPIDIQAVVAGTLQDLRIELTSAEGTIAESDLVSYLVFGVPSYQLASGQARLLEGAAGSILGTTVGAGISIGLGTLASRLSSVVAREWGLDYFAISQPEQLGLSQLNLSATLGSTTFEVGWYLEENVFLTLLLRPLGRVAGTVDPFGGARVDWVLTDTWTLQAFFEDRWLRQPTLGFDQQILNQRKVAGVLLLRDWGYGGSGGRAGPPSAGQSVGDGGVSPGPF